MRALCHRGELKRVPAKDGRWQAAFQMLEYAAVAAALPGEKINSFLDFDSLSDYAWILGAGAVLASLGYLIKGLWGSFIALLIGAFVFLYIKDFLPF
jgi:hypothetical protein